MNKLYLYVMVDPDKETKCKVGISKDPNRRLREYRTASPQCYMKHITEIPHRKHEKRILEELKGTAKVDREYVHLHPSIVVNIIDGYMLDNGIIQ